MCNESDCIEQAQWVYWEGFHELMGLVGVFGRFSTINQNND